MSTLVSPGVSVTISEDPFATAASIGTVPLFVIATASNKAAPGGAGIAASTVPAAAGKLYIATSQRDLLMSFGTPTFYSVQGTPLHGYELNEYGLHAAWSFLGLNNRAYVLRADIDLAALQASVSPPASPPLAGTYWLNLAAPRFGLFQSNGSAIAGAAWNPVTVLTPSLTNNVTGGVPSSSYGADGAFAVVNDDNANLLYQKIAGAWYAIGSSAWAALMPTTLTGLANPPALTTGDAITINGSAVSFSAYAASDVVAAINTASIPHVTAALSGAGAVIIKNTAGGALSLANTSGTPLATLGFSAGITAGVQVFRTATTDPSYPFAAITGAITPSALSVGDSFSINGVTVAFTAYAVDDVVAAINAANIPHIVATNANKAVQIANTAGGTIVLANVSGTPLATLGLPVGTVPVAGPAAGSLWVKGSPTNLGASWDVRYYNGQTGQWTVLTAPLLPFKSLLSDGTSGKDAAAAVTLGSPATGSVYVGYDPATGVQQLRRFANGGWTPLLYESAKTAPTQPPAAGSLWFNANFAADVMVSNGSQWIAYHRAFPQTDANGPLLSATVPVAHTNGDALVDGDLWIDTSDTEHYPMLYRFTALTNTWTLLDKTDRSTPFGVIFEDARADSGPSFTGIPNAGAYTYNSTVIADMMLSDYVDPDAPDPRLYPAGMLLFNTRYSTNNVKQWQPTWFNVGGFDPHTDYTVNTYTVGSSAYRFPALASAGRWVTASGNANDGTPQMGRFAQRAMVIRAMASAVETNQDIRSELIYYNLIAAPGYVELLPDLVQLNADQNDVCFVVGDTPLRLPPTGTAIQAWATNAANAASDGDAALVTGSDYAGVYYPWGLATNTDGSEIAVPPSTIALVTMAYNDQVAYPWFAPAGYHRGLVSNAATVGYLDVPSGEFTSLILNQGQRDALYLNKINPIAFIPGRGLVVYGQKTLSPELTDELSRINVARLVNYINYHLDLILKPLLFEQNDTITRKAALAIVQSFFNGLVGLRGLYDYAVVCDSSNNTPDRVVAEQLWIDCAIQPVNAVEFIYVPVRVQQLGSALDSVPGSLTTTG